MFQHNIANAQYCSDTSSFQKKKKKIQTHRLEKEMHTSFGRISTSTLGRENSLVVHCIPKQWMSLQMTLEYVGEVLCLFII